MHTTVVLEFTLLKYNFFTLLCFQKCQLNSCACMLVYCGDVIPSSKKAWSVSVNVATSILSVLLAIISHGLQGALNLATKNVTVYNDSSTLSCHSVRTNLMANLVVATDSTITLWSRHKWNIHIFFQISLDLSITELWWQCSYVHQRVLIDI